MTYKAILLRKRVIPGSDPIVAKSGAGRKQENAAPPSGPLPVSSDPPSPRPLLFQRAAGLREPDWGTNAAPWQSRSTIPAGPRSVRIGGAEDASPRHP